MLPWVYIWVPRYSIHLAPGVRLLPSTRVSHFKLRYSKLHLFQPNTSRGWNPCLGRRRLQDRHLPSPWVFFLTRPFLPTSRALRIDVLLHWANNVSRTFSGFVLDKLSVYAYSRTCTAVFQFPRMNGQYASKSMMCYATVRLDVGST